MRGRHHAVILAALFAWSGAASAVPGIERLVADVLERGPRDKSPGWIELSAEQLPSPFSDSVQVMNEHAVFRAFRSRNANAIVVFEFQKPQAVSRLQVCRSRVNLYQFHDYDPSLPYSQQLKTALQDFSQLIRFEPSGSSSALDCSVEELKDFEDYVLVSDGLADEVLAAFRDALPEMPALWRAAGCDIATGSVLREIGVTRSGDHGEENVYYVFLEDTEEHAVVHFERDDKGFAITFCDPALVD